MSTNSNMMRRTPPGILLIRSIRGQDWSLISYRYIILLLTFIAYASYHASRKPSSIVKSVLYPESMKSSDPPWPVGNVFIKEDFSGSGTNGVDNEGWYPFNGTDGTSKLGEIDVAFLACYSSGIGIFVGLFGMGYFWNIHEFWFYLSMQMVVGLFQATGWPSVVAVIGNWFGKRKRGLTMGIWNAHTSVGNISGSLLAAAVLDYGWGWSFIVPGALIASAGVPVYLFLPAYPEDIGFSGANDSSAEEEDQIQKGTTVNVEKSSDLEERSGSRTGIGLLEACSMPGVIPFALCLFFSKLVAYTFLYWLPFYLSQTEIGGEYMSVNSAGNLSTLFDVGGIVGGILAGYISDKLKAQATTAATFMFAAIPSMILYHLYGNISCATNILLMTDDGDSRALATATAIIDGTGSVGAALSPLITGYLITTPSKQSKVREFRYSVKELQESMELRVHGRDRSDKSNSLG
ncbi:putative glycerol-3-phosphate transporter 4 [Hibiscus syriacus]|uniref:Glycerol-3-phosphate transporter 4 n=1 Tax=Hibiscus syriacus TaxID=106335 RepID=A0A6A2X485_HIBSY|nr:putative glycerol-3-phosphate transporter 4 [Hibiscus syriacus]